MRRHALGTVLGVFLLAGLGHQALTGPPGAAEEGGEAEPAIGQHTAPRQAVSYAGPVGERSEAQEEAAEQQRERVQQAYRTDQVLVSPAPGASLAAIAAAHGLDVLRDVGASGYGALSASPGLAQVTAQLRDDPAVAAVAPNAITRGASSAEALQVKADDKARKVDEREAEAQAAEAWLDALIRAQASDEEIALAQLDAEEAREKAEEALEDYEDALAKADARGKLEYRAKLRQLQLHLKCTNHPKWDESFDKWDKIEEPSYAGWTVAVLDTGIAYEAWEDTLGRYVPAASLSRSAIVAPIDLVSGDEHANDDHQHGTHIASIIASDGDVAGLAPGVSLMPVKVLDAENQGTELALVEGILHAIDGGADVINMSLSFGEGYLPSPLLLDALEQAYAAGVVMVAASGNTSSGDATWPAASQRVTAVASSGITDSRRHQEVSGYANTSPQVDLTAPGGIVGQDLDDDGFDDGILAETIAPGDPSATGYWFYAGTSQAAAVVSGAAVRLLALGVPPQDVPRVLAAGAGDELDGDPYLSGWGAGTLDLTATEKLTSSSGDLEKAAHPGERYVSVMPYVSWEDKGKERQAHAIFTVVDDQGEPLRSAEVIGRVRGTQSETFSCRTDGDGSCEVKLDEVALDEDGTVDPGMAWAWLVDAVVEEGLAVRPSGMLYASQALELLTAALDEDDALAETALAIYWPQDRDEELGELAESYTVLSGGTGIATSPMGVVFTPAAVRGISEVDDISIDLDGTGIATSPMGTIPARLVSLGGEGIATSPLGLRLPPLVALHATGIATSPMTLHPLGLTQPFEGTGIATSPYGPTGLPILMDTGTIVGASSDGPLALHLQEGGWVSDDRYAPTTLLSASSLITDAASAAALGGSSAASGIGDQLDLDAVDDAPVPLLPVE